MKHSIFRFALQHTRTFRIPDVVIWSSSLYIGILSSVPKILRLGIEMPELGIDVSIAAFFTLFIWYFNLYSLPAFKAGHQAVPFSGRRIIRSLAAGIVIMFLLVLVHQWLLPKYHFLSMMLMYEFRGLIINLTIYLFINVLYQQFIARQIQVELEKTKSDNTLAQLELLKQQVNPHFLFNSLNTLKSMVEMGDRNAPHFIVMLSDFYRFSLERRKKDLISIEEELETLQAFVFLLKERFEEGLQLNIQLTPAHRHSLMPPFTLQLLLENCIKHNIVSVDQPLRVQLCSDGEFITIYNNLQPKRMVENSTQTGLSNIDQRYWHFCQKNIHIDKTDHIFSIKLPVINEYRSY